MARLLKSYTQQQPDRTDYIYEVMDDVGAVRIMTSASPMSSAEILAALPQVPDLVPTRKPDLERYARSLYEDWQRWKVTRVEAQARSLAAPIITALQNREDAAWADYLATLQAWRTAS